MKLNVLFLGDIFGKPGRSIVEDKIHFLQKKYDIDLTIANCENVTHGRGMNSKHYNQLNKLNIDLFTMGNHTFSNDEIFDYIEQTNNVIRPYNFPTNTVGVGYRNITLRDYKISVINLLGNINISSNCTNAFDAFDDFYYKVKDISDIIIVDFHAETTSEKLAFAYYVARRANICVGTHTHVATRDSRILFDNCAYISDVGMCGPLEGVIGVDKDIIIKKYLFPYKVRFKVAMGKRQLNGIVVNIEKNKVKKLEHIYIED